MQSLIILLAMIVPDVMSHPNFLSDPASSEITTTVPGYLTSVTGHVTAHVPDDSLERLMKGMRRILNATHTATYPTCTQVLFAQPLPFDKAESYCRSFDIGTGRVEEGMLTTIRDGEKNSLVANMLQIAYPGKKTYWNPTNWAWSGLRRVQNTDGAGMGGKLKFEIVYKPGEWEWADGTTGSGYESWMNGGRNNQPDQLNAPFGRMGCDERPVCRQNYMRINRAGAWDDGFRHDTHPFVCDYQGKYIVSGEKVEWLEADRICKEAGLTLAKIGSPEELDEMMSAIEHTLGRASEEWAKWDARNWIWVGATDWEIEGIWRWTVDGTYVETWNIPWVPRAGNDNRKKPGMKKGQDVLALSRQGLFDDSFEKTVHRGFACQCPGSSD